MMPLRVVVVGTRLDAAARREVAAIVQQGSATERAELQRDLQQAARQIAQDARAAAQDARQAAQEAAREGAHAQMVVQGSDPVALPLPTDGMPRITRGMDGRVTVVNPNGSTMILEPDGRYTVLDAKGHVTQSAHALTPDQSSMDIGAGVSLSALSAFVFFFLGRWWSARKYRSRVAQVASLGGSGELGGRMERIEQAVEAVAIEVERISEGQRFTTKLLSEIRSPAPLAVGEPRR
jgi:hypothetical protein